MILDNCKDFLDKLMADIKAKGIDVANLNLDHFAYQCSSNDDYDRIMPEVKKIAKLVSENIVGGRRVGIFQFNTPIEYGDRKIEAFEIIAPKVDQVCPSALEHAEFVIDTDFDTFVKRYPNLEWDMSKVNQPTFPMVTLKLSENTQVKFHLQPVLEIVKE